LPNRIGRDKWALAEEGPEIEEGWQQEEAFLFTPQEAIAKVLKEHPEFPPTTNGVNQVYEDIGGVHGHKQEMPKPFNIGDIVLSTIAPH
jgi:hypothetical protein